MTHLQNVRSQIEATELSDLEFLIKDKNGEPLHHIYAPFKRRNWLLWRIASVAEKRPIIVDRRTATGWEEDIDWQKLGN